MPHDPTTQITAFYDRTSNLSIRESYKAEKIGDMARVERMHKINLYLFHRWVRQYRLSGSTP